MHITGLNRPDFTSSPYSPRFSIYVIYYPLGRSIVETSHSDSVKAGLVSNPVYIPLLPFLSRSVPLFPRTHASLYFYLFLPLFLCPYVHLSLCIHTLCPYILYLYPLFLCFHIHVTCSCILIPLCFPVSIFLYLYALLSLCPYNFLSLYSHTPMFSCLYVPLSHCS